MSDDDVSAAVTAALHCDWEQAKKINTKLLASDPDNIDCLNRLGKALLELGEKDKALRLFRKVLRISKYDPIAKKNLERATATKAVTRTFDHHARTLTTNFIEEPGKTKLVNLVNIAQTSILLKRNYGDKINLSTRRHTVVASDLSGNYLGAVPDDLGHRLAILMKAGNLYDGLIKSVTKNSIVVFLKELSRAKRYRNTPSFPSGSSDYFSFIREDALPQTDKPVVPDSETEDQDDDEGTPASHLHTDEETEE